MKKLLLLLILLSSIDARAKLGIELQGVYLSGTQTATTKSQEAKIFYEASLLIGITDRLFAGFSVSGLTFDESIGTTKNGLVTQDMGFMGRYFFDSKRMFSVYGVYNILATAKQTNGTTNEDWNGSSFLVGAGLAPEVAKGTRIGFNLNYYNADYTSKTIGTVKTNVSNNKNWIFPSISLIYLF